jgi:2-octaprenyl-6-methoxyphenol hydroxylase
MPEANSKDDARPPRADVIVAGLGPAGLAAAVTLAVLGFEVIVAGAERAGPTPGTSPGDTRTAALMAPAVALLRHIGVWERSAASAAALRAIRIVDDTGRLLRAPEVVFRASDIGAEAFGWNVPNARLVEALLERAKSLQNLRIRPTTSFRSIAADGARAALVLGDGTRLEAPLVVAADGRGSPCRTAAGIATETWSYPQTALACNLVHTRPHEDISTELHRANGPFTVVPLPGLASSLVWVDAPGTIERVEGMADRDFLAEVETRLQGLLGRITHAGPRATFPLSVLTARRLVAGRIALVGEAAHAIPPIGAQGLNLGMRDVGHLADVLADGRAEGRDLGSAAVLDRYEAARRVDIRTRVAAVDLLNRSLLSDLLPVQALRGLGMHVLAAFPALRRQAMREGLGPVGLPRLMRSDGGGLPLPLHPGRA